MECDAYGCTNMKIWHGNLLNRVKSVLWSEKL
jgi:hypothetical protein